MHNSVCSAYTNMWPPNVRTTCDDCATYASKWVFHLTNAEINESPFMYALTLSVHVAFEEWLFRKRQSQTFLKICNLFATLLVLSCYPCGVLCCQ